jgi:hypothetical protein
MGGFIMPSIINASTSGAGGVITTADASGVLELQSGGTTVATIRASGVNAGIQVAANAAPAFSAYVGSNQSVSNSTFTKVAINTEEFDTASCFDTSNYRFTPNVAGYYQVSGIVSVGTSGITAGLSAIYKNGNRYKDGSSLGGPTCSFLASQVSALIYMNGTTDYIELYAYVTATTPIFYAGIAATSFQAAMVRSA